MDERSLKAGSFYDMGDKQYMGQSSVLFYQDVVFIV